MLSLLLGGEGKDEGGCLNRSICQTCLLADPDKARVLFHQDQAHFALITTDYWQPKLRVLGADLTGNTAECTFGSGNKSGDFCLLCRWMSVSLHMPMNLLMESTSCVREMASCFGGNTQPSQNAQRVACGR